MTIIHADNITQSEISPDSQWDIGLDKFIDWEPHSNGQLFITHVDPNPKTYPTPPHTSEPVYHNVSSGSGAEMLDDLVIGFGKKYPTKTPREILELDPQYLVWCRENTSRVFCSDSLYNSARALKVRSTF